MQTLTGFLLMELHRHLQLTFIYQRLFLKEVLAVLRGIPPDEQVAA